MKEVSISLMYLCQHKNSGYIMGREADSFHIPHIASISRGKKSYVFYSGRIRTLVAMATYNSHRLIMGNVEICNFFLSQWRYLEKKFTEMFIE